MMRRISVEKVCKAGVMATIPLLLIPLIFGSVSVLGGRMFGWPEFWRGIFCLGVTVGAACGVGTLALRLLSRGGRSCTAFPGPLRIVLQVIGAVFCTAVAWWRWPLEITEEFLYQLPDSTYPFLPVLLVLYGGWTMGLGKLTKGYTSSFSYGDFGVCSSLYLVPLALAAMFGKPYVIAPLVLSFLIYCALTVMLLNHRNVDLMMERRRHDKRFLPERIRLYNVLLAAMFLLLLGLLVLALWRSLGTVLTAFGRRAGLVAGKLIMAVVPPVRTTGHVLNRGPNLLYERTQNMVAILSRDAEEGLTSHLLTVGFAALMAYVLSSDYVYILRHFIERLARLFSRILGFLTGAFVLREPGQEAGYYTEVVEDLPPAEQSKEKERPDSRRELRRALERWRKTADPARRVREGYRLLLMAARIQGQEPEILPSDTTGQILEKSRGCSLEAAFSVASPLYDRVRYGGAIPESGELNRFSEQVEKGVLHGGVLGKR